MTEEDMVALENEVDILMKANHPNIGKLFAIYEDDKNFYMVLEYMTGGELFERIVAKEKYTEQEAAATLLQIVDALDYCHSFGIVHRDLKPENLLYSSPDESAIIKISDFGLARFVPNSEVMMTQCGTPGYVAPEIINAENQGYTKAIDYWSLGVVLYIMYLIKLISGCAASLLFMTIMTRHCLNSLKNASLTSPLPTGKTCLRMRKT